ncbi:MAG: hypothetical protein LBJ92_04740 [Holosporales bacterium]|jgi:hypothetical protein|nr:hypothetical protein [Holosporales bacterium]
MPNFNKEVFLRDVGVSANLIGMFSRVNRTRYTVSNIPDIRDRIDEFIDYDKSLFSKALDDICNNIVGNTMFTLLMMNLPPDQKLRIINIGPEEAKEPLVKQIDGSYAMHVVKINLNVYDSSDVGIPDRQYYCIDENCNITLKLKSLSGSLFHEFTHCLHHMENACKYKEDNDKKQFRHNPWYTAEECRTISGDLSIYRIVNHDPICDNCFDLYNSIVKKIPYCPRIGHWEYRSDKPRRDKRLQQFYKNLYFDLAWPRKYVIE